MAAIVALALGWLFGGLAAIELLQRLTVITSVFMHPGRSLHTSGERKRSAAASPVEEASENSRSGLLLSALPDESIRVLSGLSTDNKSLFRIEEVRYTVY